MMDTRTEWMAHVDAGCVTRDFSGTARHAAGGSIQTLRLGLLLLCIFLPATQLLAQKQALFVEANETGIIPSDQVAIDILEEMGYTVQIVSAETSAGSMATGKDIIVISESGPAADVNTKFKNTSVGVLTWEPFLYDDFQIATNVGATEAGHTQAAMADGARHHPLNGPLFAYSGDPTTATLYSEPVSVGYGTAVASAEVAMTLRSNASRAAVFAVREGATLADGTAAAGRRVGFSASSNALIHLTDDGRAAFEAAIAFAAAEYEVLFVSGQDNAADRAQRMLLASLDFAVSVIEDELVANSDANGKDLVYISESVDDAPIEDNFHAFLGGVVNNESFALDGMMWTGPTPNTDFGNSGGPEDTITIEDGTHPIAAGRSGDVQILSDPRLFTWGSPGAAASVIAHIEGQPNQKAIFAYEAGATMVGAVAAGRRVFLPFCQDGARWVSGGGYALFYNAVVWARGEGAPVVPAGISIEPTSFDFGEVEVTESAETTFLLKSTGQGTLVGSVHGGAGFPDAGFRIVEGGGPYALQSGTELPIKVTFVPTSNGEKTGYLRIFHNAPGVATPYEVTVRGEGGGQAPLGTPDLVSPANGATGVDRSPTFSWQSVETATSYQLVVSRNDDLSSPQIDRNEEGTTAGGVELSDETTYYWSVTAKRDDVESASNIWSFTTGGAPNTAPVCTDDSVTVPVDVESVLDVLANDSDGDGDTIQITGISDPPLNGNASFTTTEIRYTPSPGFVGNDMLTYTVTDGRGGTAEGQVFIKVAIQTAGAGEHPDGTTRLYPNYPNPFSAQTTVVYALADPGNVRLELLDMLGRTVRVLEDGARPRGIREILLDGSSLPVGNYVLRLQAGKVTQSRLVSVAH